MEIISRLNNYIFYKKKLHHVRDNPQFAHTAYLDLIIYHTSIEETSLQRTTLFYWKYNLYQIHTSADVDAYTTDTMETNHIAATPNQHPYQQLPALNVATTPLHDAKVPPPMAS